MNKPIFGTYDYETRNSLSRMRQTFNVDITKYGGKKIRCKPRRRSLDCWASDCRIARVLAIERTVQSAWTILGSRIQMAKKQYDRA